MKKAYNELWVNNKDSQNTLQNWHLNNLLTAEQYEASKLDFPVGFNRSTIFVKIGLFIFTNIVVSAISSFVFLFFSSLIGDSQTGIGILALVSAAIFLYLLEYFIKKNNFFHNGVDNALLYAMLVSVLLFFGTITNFELPLWTYCLIALLILTPALLRYADLFVVFGFYSIWITLWFDLLTKFPLGKLILPFVIMAVSAVSYAGVKFWRKKDKSSYYNSCRDILELLTLATFYLGGNYLVVREGNAVISNLSNSIQISFAPLFYIFTIIIPIFYVFRGLQKHDRQILLVGILAVAFSIFTYLHYFSNVPLEWVLTIGGTILIMLTIAAMKYLKTPKYRLTNTPKEANNFQNLEAFIITQTMPHVGDKGADLKFGDGDFGGGGATEGY